MGLSELANIGKTLEKELNGIGINTYEDLVAQGSVEIAVKLTNQGVACYNKLYALEGAIKGKRWHSIPRVEKDRILPKWMI